MLWYKVEQFYLLKWICEYNQKVEIPSQLSFINSNIIKYQYSLPKNHSVDIKRITFTLPIPSSPPFCNVNTRHITHQNLMTQ